MSKKATIADVAIAANVSASTVSNILNRSGSQSPETIAHVHSVMLELGYVPRKNKLRRRSISRVKKIKSFALLFPDTTGLQGIDTPLTRGLISGVQRYLSEEGFKLHVVTLNEDGSLPDIIKKHQVDGVICRPGFHDMSEDVRQQDLVELSRIPLVWAFNFDGSFTTDTVSVDNESCGFWAAKRALEFDGTSFYSICSEDPRLYMLPFRNRVTAFEFALELEGKIMGNLPFERIGDLPVSGRTAIFVPGHDADVKNVYEYLQTGKLGKDVCLLGVMTEETDLSSSNGYHIETIHIDPFRVGWAAAKQLVWRMEHQFEPYQRLLVPPKEMGREAPPMESGQWSAVGC